MAWVATWRQTIDGKRKPRQLNFYFPPGDEEAEAKAYAEAVAHRKAMERLHYTGKF